MTTSMTVSPLVSRLAAVALLVALLTFGWLAAVQPVIAELRDTGARIEQARDLLLRYEAINAGRADLEAELARWREEVLPESGLFPGDDPAVVAAELQSSVSAMIKQSGGDLLSIQILRGQDEGRLQTVPVRVQFSASLESAMDIFYDLESARPYLFLDNLQVRTGRVARRLRASRSRSGEEPVEQLFVTGDVYGYVRTGPAS
ncbi:MAG TPA: type II secretion system protein GspM [Geminicoccaceae bacterium]|nr:type II secretion system protein GspM [Geminicoccaceae bacterium]